MKGKQIPATTLNQILAHAMGGPAPIATKGARWNKSGKARPHLPLNNPFTIMEDYEKLEKENAKLKEKVRKLEGEIFDLVVLEDHVPKSKLEKSNKKKQDGSGDK